MSWDKTMWLSKNLAKKSIESFEPLIERRYYGDLLTAAILLSENRFLIKTNTSFFSGITIFTEDGESGTGSLKGSNLNDGACIIDVPSILGKDSSELAGPYNFCLNDDKGFMYKSKDYLPMKNNSFQKTKTVIFAVRDFNGDLCKIERIEDIICGNFTIGNFNNIALPIISVDGGVANIASSFKIKVSEHSAFIVNNTVLKNYVRSLPQVSKIEVDLTGNKIIDVQEVDEKELLCDELG